MSQLLIPNFSDGEPNLKSTRKKNENGKCCFYGCGDKLPEKKYEYMGFLACEKCGKRLEAEMKKLADEAMMEFIQRYIKCHTTN